MKLADIYKIYLEYPHILIDTRRVVEHSIFVAVGRKDENGVHRGCQFAQKALDLGASYVIINDPVLKAAHAAEDNWILVEDGEECLWQLAQMHRKQLNIPIIAIAGSNGKTTTKELLHAALSSKYHCFATQGNLNNHLGVPLSILQILPHFEMAILEIGANHVGETKELTELAMPTHGILTNCGKDHLGEYGSFENIIKANKELYDYFAEAGGIVFVNAEDHLLTSIAVDLKDPIYYGESYHEVYAELLETPFVKVKLWVKGASREVPTALFGAFWREALAGVAQIAAYFEVDIDSIQQALSAYRPDALRSQLLEWEGHSLLLDCYNANPSSMEAFVKAAQQSPENPKVLILGEMLELGDYSDEEHNYLLQTVLDASAYEKVLVVGAEFQKIKLPNYENLIWALDAKEAKELIKIDLKQKKYYIYVKGSRGNKLESMFLD